MLNPPDRSNDPKRKSKSQSLHSPATYMQRVFGSIINNGKTENPNRTPAQRLADSRDDEFVGRALARGNSEYDQ